MRYSVAILAALGLVSGSATIALAQDGYDSAVNVSLLFQARMRAPDLPNAYRVNTSADVLLIDSPAGRWEPVRLPGQRPDFIRIPCAAIQEKGTVGVRMDCRKLDNHSSAFHLIYDCPSADISEGTDITTPCRVTVFVQSNPSGGYEGEGATEGGSLGRVIVTSWRKT